MIYGFDTDDEDAAVAALLVYVVWRSRDRAFKVGPEVWAQIERFAKDCAKRARSLSAFLEALKGPRRLSAGTLHPRHLAVGMAGSTNLIEVRDADGALKYALDLRQSPEDTRREFGVQIISRANPAPVIRLLYAETAWIILLVRDRLERERPIEQKLGHLIDDESELGVLQ